MASVVASTWSCRTVKIMSTLSRDRMLFGCCEEAAEKDTGDDVSLVYNSELAPLLSQLDLTIIK